jgi:two-component system chemotaxis response regulator CheY
VDAKDGLEGLAQIEAHPDAGLIFCDLAMPRMNGIAMIEDLARRKWNSAPIVMLTTETDLTALIRARQAGATGWIVKPYQVQHLVAVVRKLAR